MSRSGGKKDQNVIQLEIKLERPQLEAELEELNQLREAEAVSAKADVMEAAVKEFSMDVSMREYRVLSEFRGACNRVVQHVLSEDARNLVSRPTRAP